MLNTMVEAAKNFCIHQIGEDCEISNATVKNRTYIAYIDLSTEDGKKYRAYIALEDGFVQKITSLFLEEDNSNEETLKDMTLETTNLIVGSAKVIAEERHKLFNIDTPHFQKVDIFDYEYDEIKILSMNNYNIILAIKELDA
jgi:hypothetical protein